MEKRLVIVESPAKAKTIGKYLPEGCKVTATMGHVIDLPASKLGIDIENNFTPEYKPIRGKKKILDEIKKEMKTSDEVILATDPDREGEVISYHLANYLGLDTNAQNRIEFHEITENAIKSAMKNKRAIDMALVDAQQARRVLDRLVGYQVSPVLWKKVMRGLSAGRVQSAATRIIVDRENEIRNFVPAEYWNISSFLHKENDALVFEAKLTQINGKKAEVHDKETADKIYKDLKSGVYAVSGIKKSERKRKPYAPFTTSTLQQDAYRKLNMSTKKTMMLAQQLYEGLELKDRGHVGLITYIRTDSVRIADEAAAAAKAYIAQNYGKEYVGYGVFAKKKGANVQDAHEAIRPTDVNMTPAKLAPLVNSDQLRLYTLIYNRFLASQMADAVFDTVAADITSGIYTLHATGSKLKFAGFIKAYNPEDDGDKDMAIPELAPGEICLLDKVSSEQKFTQPPARYTEGSLVKALEELGIGRPSTYAPTISTIIARDYVALEDKKFVPTVLGEAVTKLLEENFSEIVDVSFTAQMEENLDEIAGGEKEWVAVIDKFYAQLKTELDKSDSIERVQLPVIEVEETCPNCGRNLVIKNGRFGKFLACPGYPECSFTKAITKKIEAPCPKCGGEVVERKSKKGRIFYGCKNYPECDYVSWNKPSVKKCPQCGKELYENASGKKLFCADKECGYKED